MPACASEFRGCGKVVDHPRANRALHNRPCHEEPLHDMGVFGTPESMRPGHARGRKQDCGNYSRVYSKTTIFGTTEASVPPRSTGRKHVEAQSSGESHPRGRRYIAERPDQALSPENYRPLAPSERPVILGPKDVYAARPKSSLGHKKAVLSPREQDKSVLFSTSGDDCLTAPSDATALSRYDKRFTRQPERMQRYQCRPAPATTAAAPSPMRVGKRRLSGSADAPSLDGVLRPDSKPAHVDPTYRPVAPWFTAQ